MPLTPEERAEARKWKDERRKRQLTTSIGLASQPGVDPSAARKAQQVQYETGIPASVAETDINRAQSLATTPSPNPVADLADTPAVAEWMSDPAQARMSIDDMEQMKAFERAQRRKEGYWKNVGLGMGERTNSLTGNLIQFASHSIDGYEQIIETLGLAERDSLNFSDKVRGVGTAIAEGGLGYESQYNWEDFKDEPTVANLAGYVMETGAMSMVDIGGMMLSLPLYLASKSNETGNAIAERDGRDSASAADVIRGMPTAVAVTLIDRWSAKGALGLMTKGKVGKLTWGHAGREIGKATAREGATEFLQEQVEYIGETMGTKYAYSTPNRVKLLEQLDRGAAGMVAGGPMGAAMRGASLPLDAVSYSIQQRMSDDIKTVGEQQSLDGMIYSIQNMKLNQEAPDVARGFFKGMDPNDKVYLTPEAVRAAVDEGFTIPDYLQAQLDAGTDVSLSVEDFAMDVVSDSNLTERLRPHMKRSPDAQTQSEIQNRDTTRIERLMNLAKTETATKTEADEIHEEVAAQLVASGRLSAASAKISAAIIPAYVTSTVADLRGRGQDVTVREVYDLMNFKVEPAKNAKPPAKPYVPPPEIENAAEIGPQTDTTVEIVEDGAQEEMADPAVEAPIEEGQAAPEVEAAPEPTPEPVAEMTADTLRSQITDAVPAADRKKVQNFVKRRLDKGTPVAEIMDQVNAQYGLSLSAPEQEAPRVTDEAIAAAITEAGVVSADATPEQIESISVKPKTSKKVRIQHANPRIDMYFKEVTQRIPELTEAAKKVESGEMTTAEYSRLVNEYKPVTPYDEPPVPNSLEEISSALTKNKTDKVGAPAKTLEEGHKVGVRLDIPAYRDHGVWAVSIHEPGAGFKAGKSVGYESVALVTEATLGAHEPMSMKIATGKAKSTIAVVKGAWKNISVEESVEMARAAIDDPAWVQVGYDPERHSYFYNRATMEPVVAGAEVLQVGPLTLVKNPTYGDPNDFLFQDSEIEVEGIDTVDAELDALNRLLNCTRGA